MKTRKSIAKRFRITRNGIILRRPTGQDHNRSKRSGKKIRAGRKWVKLSKSEVKRIKQIIHG